MLTKLIYGAIVTLLFAALTVGAVSAMGGGSHDSDEADSQEETEPTATPIAEDDEDITETEGPEDSDVEEADEAETEDELESSDPAGNQKIAQAIADEFGVTPEEVLALHDQGIGFGAIFKLYSIARAKGITVEELLAEIDADGGGFAFGKLKKSLTEEEMAILEEGPKNLGALVSEASKNGDEDAAAEGAAFEGSPDDGGSAGGGPPAHAKAKGHGKKN